MINLKHLGDLKISLPALDRQSKIEKIAGMLTKETALLEEIKRKREKYVERLLIRAAS